MAQKLTAVITGSTSGIGLGIATAFAAEGMNIMLNGFGDKDEIEKARRSLSTKYGVDVRFNGADMTKPNEIRTLISATEEAFGQVDVLVNNAGIQHVEKIESFPDAKWDAIIAINMSSAFHTIKATMELSLIHI